MLLSADEGCKACEICHRDDRDPAVKIVRLITGVNHPQVVQMQIFQGYQHRTLSGGRIGIF